MEHSLIGNCRLAWRPIASFYHVLCLAQARAGRSAVSGSDLLFMASVSEIGASSELNELFCRNHERFGFANAADIGRSLFAAG